MVTPRNTKPKGNAIVVEVAQIAFPEIVRLGGVDRYPTPGELAKYSEAQLREMYPEFYAARGSFFNRTSR